MNKEQRLAYEGLVIKSLKTGKKDFSSLATDIYLKLLEKDKGIQGKVVKSNLSTDILLKMINDGKIKFDEGIYELPQEVIL